MKHQTKLFSLLGFLTILALAMSSCIKDENPGPGMGEQYNSIQYKIRQIPDLGFDYSFHAWAEDASEIYYLGEIIADNNGEFSGEYNFQEGRATDITRFFISLEPFDDQDPAPSDWVLLESEFSGSEGLVNNAPFIEEGVADLATGTYILASPTTASNTDESKGIWFVGNATGTTRGLDLPILESGWKYEAWVNTGKGTLSAGGFLDPGGSDDRSVYSASERPPFPFPGEDFIQGLPGFQIDSLQNSACYISIEPEDGVSSPFFLQILQDEISAGTTPRTVQNLLNPGSGGWLLAEIQKK